MTTATTLTFVLMDAPFESSRTATALRVIDEAIRRGRNVNVFAYEGAVMLPFRHQQQHATWFTLATRAKRTTRFPASGSRA